MIAAPVQRDVDGISKGCRQWSAAGVGARLVDRRHRSAAPGACPPVGRRCADAGASQFAADAAPHASDAIPRSSSATCLPVCRAARVSRTLRLPGDPDRAEVARELADVLHRRGLRGLQRVLQLVAEDRGQPTMSWQVRQVARRAGIDDRPDPADAVRLADEGQPAAHRMRRRLADLDVDDHVGPFQRAHDLAEPGRLLLPNRGRARRPCRAAGRGAGRRARRRRWRGGRDRDRLRTARRRRAHTRRRTRVAWPSWRNSLERRPLRADGGSISVVAVGRSRRGGSREVRRGSRTLRRWLAGVAASRGGASSRWRGGVESSRVTGSTVPQAGPSCITPDGMSVMRRLLTPGRMWGIRVRHEPTCRVLS